MVFSDIAFLLIFLPIIGILFHLLQATPLSRYNYIMLTLGSLAFYYAGGGLLVILLIISALINWIFGLFVDQQRSKFILSLGIALNLIPLIIFKYLDFFIDNINLFFFQEIPNFRLILPIGISFYTFQGLSYLIDVYRRDLPAIKNPIFFLLYISFFPQLIAGPIVRIKEILTDLYKLQPSSSDISAGILRFTWGLSKKVLIADPISKIADLGFNYGVSEPTFAIAWLALLAYTLQIYFDFSGYSDMAIGIGRTFGLKFPRNFFHPYSAISITDFWRRWHITLSSWFRDYLYIPLGGSRTTQRRAYVNLWIVFLVTGFWHGAAWTFIYWGLLHGLYLVIERVAKINDLNNYVTLRRCLTIFLVMMAWVLFRSESVPKALEFYYALFNYSDFFNLKLSIKTLQILTFQNILPLLVGGSIFFLSRNSTIGEKIEATKSLRLKLLIILVLLPICIIEILAVGYRPFLYFQF